MLTALSLSKACAAILGKPLLKAEQTSDWEASELSSAQLEYAALDAHCLLGLLHEVIGHMGLLEVEGAGEGEEHIGVGVKFSDDDFPVLGSGTLKTKTKAKTPSTAPTAALARLDIGVAGMYIRAATAPWMGTSSAGSVDSDGAHPTATDAPLDSAAAGTAQEVSKMLQKEIIKSLHAVSCTIGQFMTDIG